MHASHTQRVQLSGWSSAVEPNDLVVYCIVLLCSVYILCTLYIYKADAESDAQNRTSWVSVGSHNNIRTDTKKTTQAKCWREEVSKQTALHKEISSQPKCEKNAVWCLTLASTPRGFYVVRDSREWSTARSMRGANCNVWVECVRLTFEGLWSRSRRQDPGLFVGESSGESSGRCGGIAVAVEDYMGKGGESATCTVHER